MVEGSLESRTKYLQSLVLVLALVSLVLPLAPTLGSGAFSLMIYGSTSYPQDFSPEAVSYIRLTNAVLGSVMAGWFATMFVLLQRTGLTPVVRAALLIGLMVWFVPDTVYSLMSGYWQNAVLNAAILSLFLPLALGLRGETASS